MDYREAAQKALDIQDACNLSGVAHTFIQVLAVLRDQGKGTDWVNKHPITALFIDKFASLNGTQVGLDGMSDQYGAVYAIIAGEGVNEYQLASLRRKYVQDNSGHPTFLDFAKTVQIGGDCLMVHWCNMWLGIEKDGYTHS